MKEIARAGAKNHGPRPDPLASNYDVTRLMAYIDSLPPGTRVLRIKARKTA